MKYLIAAATLAAGSPAFAEDIRVTPIVDGRLRHETVDEQGFTHTADAITARVRAGFAASAEGPVFRSSPTLKISSSTGLPSSFAAFRI